jgi:uncharacterized protein (TIGR04222 family)
MQMFQMFTHTQGPVFLVAYATLWVAFFIICLIVRKQTGETPLTTGKSESSERAKVATSPDPYQIAYLRGGANEVLRLATLELYCQNLLQEEKSRFLGTVKWQLNAAATLPENLSPFAREAATFYSKSRKPTEIFASSTFFPIDAEFQKWDRWIEEQGFRIPGERQARLNYFVIGLTGLFITVGGIKLGSALLRGIDNVFFGFGLMVVGSIALLLTGRPRRFSDAGREFLQNTQLVHNKQLKAVKGWENDKAMALSQNPGQSSNMAESYASIAPLLAMGIFGVAALNGSPLNDFRKKYLQSESTGGGCGSSCAGASCSGSSGDSGASTGSSCGGGSGSGCGGGGGGCGGGCGGCGS